AVVVPVEQDPEAVVPVHAPPRDRRIDEVDREAPPAEPRLTRDPGDPRACGAAVAPLHRDRTEHPLRILGMRYGVEPLVAGQPAVAVEIDGGVRAHAGRAD